MKKPFAHANVNIQYLRQEGTSSYDGVFGVVVVEDGTLIFAGYTQGAWAANKDDELAELAMVKMDSNGTVIWRWQVRLH